MSHNKTLNEIHEDVPPDHYDNAIQHNLFQKYWHHTRFTEISKIAKPVKGKVLDVGCHSGTFTKVISKKTGSDKIFGVDISKKAIALAKKRLPKGTFQVSDCTKLPFPANSFDAVFCLEVLEHVDKPIEALKEIKRVMNNKAYGVIMVPTDNLLFRYIWFFWTLYYPVWQHAHVQSFQKKRLESQIKKAGLKITQIKTFNLGMLKIVTFEK